MADFDALTPATTELLRRHGLLRPLVQQLVTAEAVSHEELPPEALEQVMAAYGQQQGLEPNNSNQLKEHLEARGLSLDDLQWQLLLPQRVRQHVQEHFIHKAESRFLERKNQLDQVIYSLLRVKDGLLARELYLRLAGGEANFADLANAFAEGPEKQTRGIVGPVPLTQAHPQLAERLRISKIGELLEPFNVAEWWLVVRLEQRIPANFDETMAERMGQELFQEWVAEQVEARLSALASPSA